MVMVHRLPSTAGSSGADSRVLIERVFRRGKLRLEPYIVVRVFAHLRVVDADDLGFFGAAQLEVAPGEEVHAPEDDGLQRKETGNW